MATEVNLYELVGSSLEGADQLTLDDLERLWWRVVPRDAPNGRAGLDSVQDLFTQLDSPEILEFKLGAWRWDVKTGLMNSIVSSVLIGGILQSTGFIDMAGFTLPAVLALLFKMDATRIEGYDRQLLIYLEERTNSDGSPRTVDELYELLPADDQRALSRLQFAAFVDKIRDAGRANKYAEGIYSLVSEDDERWLRINIKW